MTNADNERTLTFPWDPEHPMRVVIVREYGRKALVKTVDPDPGCYEDAYPVRLEWLT